MRPCPYACHSAEHALSRRGFLSAVRFVLAAVVRAKRGDGPLFIVVGKGALD